MAEGFSIEGLAELGRKLAEKAAELQLGAAAAVAAEVKLVKEDAKAGAPIGPTGKLRESIEGHSEGVKGEVETNVRYAPFVEHGTYKDPAQPFMGPAAERSRVRFKETAGAYIKAALEGKG